MKVFHKTRFTGQTTDVRDPFALKKKKSKPRKTTTAKGGVQNFHFTPRTTKTTAFDTAQPAQHDHGHVSFTHTPMAMPGPCSSNEAMVQLSSPLLSLSYPQSSCLCLPSPFSDVCRSPQLLFVNPGVPWMSSCNQNLWPPTLLTQHPSLGPKAL